MKNNYELLSNLKSKISEEQFQDCKINCPNLIQKDGVFYCSDKKCRSHKKRVYTRQRNILIRSKWRELEGKLSISEKRLFDDPIFPYILLELIIEQEYDEDIRELLANKLNIPVSKLKKEGINKIYKLENLEVKKIVESIVLRKVGLKRAEQLVRDKL